MEVRALLSAETKDDFTLILSFPGEEIVNRPSSSSNYTAGYSVVLFLSIFRCRVSLCVFDVHLGGSKQLRQPIFGANCQKGRIERTLSWEGVGRVRPFFCNYPIRASDRFTGVHTRSSGRHVYYIPAGDEIFCKLPPFTSQRCKSRPNSRGQFSSVQVMNT